MNRRTLLGTLASGGVIAAAGCVGGSSGGGGGGTTTSEGDTLDTHPAAGGIADRPTLGPDPAEAGGVLVAFEDPSCPTCRRFETGAFPEIKANLVDPGEAAFVFRTYPIVYEWGKPAVQALEATYARDADAFWALKSHYYAEQDTFTTENVLSETESFLSSETNVDAAGVVADAEAKAYDDRVQANLDAGDAAGATATPSVFLFSEGEFVTKVVGAKPYSVYRDALEG
jgi:protein-disulfide isomerase